MTYSQHDIIPTHWPKVGALSSLGMALCYICLFIIFGVFVDIPATASVAERINYIAQHKLLFVSAYSIGYLLFGTLLGVTVVVHNRMARNADIMMQIASLFGAVWVVLMMATGMISLIGFDVVIALHAKDSSATASVFQSLNLVLQGLGGGIELVGGLWVLLLSCAGLREKQLGKGLHLLGLMVGSFAVLTLAHQVSLFKELFGVTQIVWFIWLGLALTTAPRQTEPAAAQT